MQRKWRVSAVVCTGMFMSSLDLFIVNIAFPAIRHDFGHASVASLSWILSAYSIVFAALLVPAGRWADAYGRKRVFLIGLLVFVAASAGCAAAPSVAALTAARVVQAAGGAFMMPTSLGLMLPEFEPRERAAAIGIWAAAGGLAAASGPPLGGLLVELDWRLVFLVNLPVGLLGLTIGRRLLREHRELGAPRPDVLGAAGFTVAVAAIVLAIVEGQTWGWASAPTIALFAIAPVVVVAVWRRSVGHRSPIFEPGMLRVRSFSLALGGSILFYAGFGAMLLGGVLFLTGVWHESVLTAGLMLAPGPILAATFSVVSSRLAGRLGFRALGVFGTLLVAAAAIWWILRIGDTPSYPTTYLPGMLLTGTGVGFTIPVLTGAGAASLPPERFATGVAVITMGRQVGAALGVAILVAVLAGGASTAAAFHQAWLIVLCGALGAAVTLASLGPAPRRIAVSRDPGDTIDHRISTTAPATRV